MVERHLVLGRCSTCFALLQSLMQVTGCQQCFLSLNVSEQRSVFGLTVLQSSWIVWHFWDILVMIAHKKSYLPQGDQANSGTMYIKLLPSLAFKNIRLWKWILTSICDGGILCTVPHCHFIARSVQHFHVPWNLNWPRFRRSMFQSRFYYHPLSPNRLALHQNKTKDIIEAVVW